MATIPKSKPAQTKVVAKAPASKINPLQAPISSPDILPPMMPALRTPARPIVAPKPIAGAAPRAAAPGSKIPTANYIDEQMGAFTPPSTPVKTIQRTPAQRAVAPGAKVNPIGNMDPADQFLMRDKPGQTPAAPINRNPAQRTPGQRATPPSSKVDPYTQDYNAKVQFALNCPRQHQEPNPFYLSWPP
jgi:hypothetical protein